MSDDGSRIVELTRQNFAESINDHPFAVIDFWAPWCAPCRAFAPVFAAAAERHPDALFGKVNTEEQREIAAYFQIRSIPTLAIFRDNIIVFSEAGALPAAKLEHVLAQARSLDMADVRKSIEAQLDAEPPPGG